MVSVFVKKTGGVWSIEGGCSWSWASGKILSLAACSSSYPSSFCTHGWFWGIKISIWTFLPYKLWWVWPPSSSLFTLNFISLYQVWLKQKVLLLCLTIFIPLQEGVADHFSACVALQELFYAICNKNANINVFSYLFVVPPFSNIYISLLMQNKRLFKFISRRIHIQTHMADRFW